jgi:hypothetical protein
MKRFLKLLLTALVLYAFAAVSVRVAPTPGGWKYELGWGIVIAAGILYLWLGKRPKRKL